MIVVIEVGFCLASQFEYQGKFGKFHRAEVEFLGDYTTRCAENRLGSLLREIQALFVLHPQLRIAELSKQRQR